MLYPGIRKLAKQLGLYSSGKTAFGIHKGFSLCAFDGNNKKILMVRLQKNLPDDDITALRHKYKFKKCEYLVDKNLQIEFGEMFAPYSVKKIYRIIEEIIAICQEKGIESILKCDQCDNRDFGFYKYSDMPLLLCEPCYQNQSSKLNQNKNDFDRIENNYLSGAIGAFIFSLIGIIPQILFFVFLERMAALSSLIYCMLALKGYSYFKGKTTPPGALIIITLSLIMTILGTVLSYTAFLFKEVKDLEYTLQLLLRQDIQSELISNIIIQLIVSFLILILEFFSIRKNWTFKTIEKAQAVR